MAIPNPLLDPLKSILVYNRRRIYIDNVFFRMHYVWSTIFLVTCAIMVTSKIYVGEPINCMASPDVKDIVKQYCFIHSTFTRGKFDKKGGWTYEPAVKENEIYPGIRPAKEGEGAIHHTYYQWVWCVLIVQAVSFYFPHWAWEKWEGGTTMMLVGDLNLPMLPDEKKIKHRKKILLYLRRNRGFHTKYAVQYAFCEFLNLVNIVLQVFLTDFFVNNAFTDYGLNVLTLTQEKPYMRDDELARVFPTVTACRLATGGVAFGKQNYDILCILPINILNEKIYIFLWFWFLLLAICSTISVIYRCLSLIPPFRRWIMRSRVRLETQKESADSLVDSNNYGEWFLIYKLSQNMDCVTFGDLILDIDQAYRKWDDVKLPDEEHYLAVSAPRPSMEGSPYHHGEFNA
ncbi:innexin inx2 isoform X1 [Folsomia candida]|nr:innexin inx2 isoform X1 [Folsomia candida]XP_035703329.1 innexin inx2 isoform X1 [Folsomia candida]